MKTIDLPKAQQIIADLKPSKGLQRRLSFAPLGDISAAAWDSYDFFGLPTKDRGAGILFVESRGSLYVTTYEISPMSSQSTGRTKPVICDFCKTWQAGGRAGSITFRPTRRSLNSVSFLCCLDLACSLHVRDMTTAAKSSRAQLREDISPDQRIERLRSNLLLLVEKLNLKAL